MPRAIWRSLWGLVALLCGAGCGAPVPEAPLPEALPTLTPEVARVEVEGGAPRALGWLPEGPQGGPVRAVAVTFDRPMAPEARLTLSPPVQGEQRWIGPQILLWTPAEALPPSSYFVASVEGARGARGDALERPPLWTFTTARPALLSVEPPQDEPLPEPSQALTLVWNQPVSLASLQERLGLSSQADQHRAVPFRLACAVDARGAEDCARVVVTPRAPYRPGARVFLTLQAGVRGVGGPLPSERAWKHGAVAQGRARATRPPPPPPVGAALGGPEEALEALLNDDPQALVVAAPVPERALHVALAAPAQAALPSSWRATLRASASPLPLPEAQGPQVALVRLERPDGQRDARVIRRGPLSVTVHAGRAALMAWLRGPRALTSGARVALRGGDGALLWEGRADEDGIAALPWLGRYDAPAPWFVIAGDPDAYTFATLPEGAAAQPSPPEGALFVPAVGRQPGQPIYLSGALPGASSVRLGLVAPDGKRMVSLSMATDSAGRFDAAPRLPWGAPEGLWRVEAAPDGPGGALAAEVVVGEPAAARAGGPRVRLSAEALGPQEPLYVDVRQGAGLRYEARRSWAPLRSASLPGFVFGEQREVGEAPRVSSGALRAGAEGEGSVALLAGDDARRDGPEEVVVQVWGAQGEVIERRALRHTAARYLGLQVRPRLTRPGERVSVKLVAANPEGAPLSHVPARVTLERWAEGAWQERAVCRVRTQAAPSVCGFTPQEAGRWRVMARGEGDAQEATASAPLWVLGEGAALGSAPEVEVTLDREPWEPGGRGLALLRAPWGRADFLVTLDFGEGGQRRALLRDSPGWVALPVEVPTDATRAELRVSAASGSGEVSWGAVEAPLQVSAPGLAVEARAPALTPGRRARLQVRVTRQGAPAEALVSAALVDPERRGLALWRGKAAVGAGGVVELPLEAPDRAGAWRLELFARDAQGRSGRLTQEVAVESPLEPVFVVPGALREGDALALALGLKAASPTQCAAARVWAEPEGALAVDDAPVALEVGVDASARVRALRAGPARLCVEVQAQDGEPRRRCEEVEVWPGAQEEVFVQRAVRGDHMIELPTLPPEAAAGASWEVWLDSAPLVGAEALLERLRKEGLTPSLPELVGRVLALSVLRRPALLARLGPRGAEEVEVMLREALEALARLQLPEGGFGLWEGASRAHLSGSLWAGWALESAQEGDVRPDPAVLALAREHTLLLIERGEAPLTRERPHPDERALAVALLGRFAPSRRSFLRDLEPLAGLGEGLSAEARALLALAWSDQPRRARLGELLGPLERSARREDGVAAWPEAAPADALARWSSARRTGAVSLLAMVAAAPDAALTRLIGEGLLRDPGRASWLEEGLRLEALLALHKARPAGPLTARLEAPGGQRWEIAQASAGWRLEARPGQAPPLRLSPAAGAPVYVRAALRWPSAQEATTNHGEALAVALPAAGVAGEAAMVRLLLALPRGGEAAWIELPEGPGWRWGEACVDSQALVSPKVVGFSRGPRRSLLRVEGRAPGIYALCVWWTPARAGEWAVPPVRLVTPGGASQSASARVRVRAPSARPSQAGHLPHVRGGGRRPL